MALVAMKVQGSDAAWLPQFVWSNATAGPTEVVVRISGSASGRNTEYVRSIGVESSSAVTTKVTTPRAERSRGQSPGSAGSGSGRAPAGSAGSEGGSEGGAEAVVGGGEVSGAIEGLSSPVPAALQAVRAATVMRIAAPERIRDRTSFRMRLILGVTLPPAAARNRESERAFSRRCAHRYDLRMSSDSRAAFIERLAASPAGPNSVNFFDHSRPDNAIRRRNLARYLEQLAGRGPTTLLVGEAPGYRGMAITGVPFTNTTLLARGIPHFDLFGGANGYEIPDAPGVAAEPTATVMWNALTELDFLPVLWSAYPLHPHRPGNPLSNRTPSSSEAAAWSWSWRALIDVFSIRSVVAVGNVSRDTLARSGLSVPHVRHPAHGGREKFTLGLRDLLAQGVIA